MTTIIIHFIIPKRHTTDFFSMTAAERTDAQILLSIRKNSLAGGDESIEEKIRSEEKTAKMLILHRG